MMPSSQKGDLSVYDFDEKEESVEVLSGKLRSRFDPKRRNTGDKDLVKYDFLQAFKLNSEQKDSTEVSCIDLCEGVTTQMSYAVDTAEENPASIEKSGSDEIIASKSNSPEHDQICEDESGHGTRSDSRVMGTSNLLVPSDDDKQFSEAPSEESIDVISDDEECWESDSGLPSTSASNLSESEGLLGSPVSDYPAYGETYDNDMAVIVSPDYILYEKTVYGESQFTFFSDCIKMECFDASRNDDKFVLDWAVADVIHIHCQWTRSAEAAIIIIWFSATGLAGTKKVTDNPDTTKLIFSVTGINWLEKEQKIKSLAPRYKDVWNAHSNGNGTMLRASIDKLDYTVTMSDDMALEDELPERTQHYLIENEESFEDVIYPKGDPDAVSINKRDIELLQPDTFINDTIIDFYIKYLKNNIRSGEKQRFHFFNSFFFRKLADLDKDPGSALEGRAAFQRVRKWTRKVNLFDKDYIFVPVNYNLHWSLLVICHPGDIATVKDDVKESPKVPCILHMDSIEGSHSGLKTLIQGYLREEWKERHPKSPEEILSKFSGLRFVELELPQQENSFDCGLFLLHYVELFLEKAPASFNPFKVTKFSRFLTADWFLPAEASLKRSVIRRLIYDLLKDPSHPSSRYPEKENKQEPAVNFLSENCSAAKSIYNDSAHFAPDSRIEIKLLSSSAPGVAQCDKGLVLREFLEPRPAAYISYSDYPFQKNTPQNCNCIGCPIEEHVNTREQKVSTGSEKDNCPPMDVNRSERICSTSYTSKDAGAYQISWSSMQEKDVGMDFSLCSLNSDCVVSNSKNETEKQQSLQEYCGYVPNSPTAFFGEKLESYAEDSQKINIDKAEGDRCDDSQAADTTEADSGIGKFCQDKAEGDHCEASQGDNTREAGSGTDKNSMDKAEGGHCEVSQGAGTMEAGSFEDNDSQHFNATKAEIWGGEDYQSIYTAKVERVRSVDYEKNNSIKVGSENCQETNTAEAEGVIDEDQVTGTADAGSDNGEHQITGSADTGSGDGEHRATGTADTESGVSEHQVTGTAGSLIDANSTPCLSSHQSPSQQDIVSFDDESTLNTDDPVLTRGEPVKNLGEEPPLKRRKLLFCEGGTRHS